MRNHWRISWWVIIILFSCSRPREACLDINATNYDVKGEVDCRSCCTYPNLAVRFSVDFGGEPLVLNQFVYENNFGETYGVVSGRLLFSDIILTTRNGVDFRVRDSLLLPLLNSSDSLFFKNDFLFISDLSERTYRLGRFPVENNFVRVGLHLGLQGEACDIDPFETPPNENIGRALRALYEQDFESYYAARFELLVDTAGAEMQTKVIYLPLCNMASHAGFDTDIGGTPGFDLLVRLHMNIKEAIDNIRISELDSLNVLPQWRNDILSALHVE